MTIRDPSQLHLLFAELADPAAIAELARAQITSTRPGSQTLEETEARLADDAIRAQRLGPLRLGRARLHGRDVLLDLGRRGPRLARFLGSVGRSGR